MVGEVEIGAELIGSGRLWGGGGGSRGTSSIREGSGGTSGLAGSMCED
jgi:hypothetical protein